MQEQKKWKHEQNIAPENAFDVLPNELVSVILLCHLDPIWHHICKRVCRLWQLLLAYRPSSTVASEFTTILARGGHLNVIQWARSQGSLWDERTCANAAGGGYLEVLQWLRSQGCPWDKGTCEYAAYGGHLEVLQWARSQGCPWDEQTYAFATLYGQWKVLRWAISNGCPVEEYLAFDHSEIPVELP